MLVDLLELHVAPRFAAAAPRPPNHFFEIQQSVTVFQATHKLLNKTKCNNFHTSFARQCRNLSLMMNTARACPAGFGGMSAILLYCGQEAAVGRARNTHGGFDIRAGYLMDVREGGREGGRDPERGGSWRVLHVVFTASGRSQPAF
jgi:hypothetical protein